MVFMRDIRSSMLDLCAVNTFSVAQNLLTQIAEIQTMERSRVNLTNPSTTPFSLPRATRQKWWAKR